VRLTAMKTRLNEKLEMFLLQCPVNLLGRCALEPRQTWDVDSGRVGSATFGCE
jgi:hypothetical protein